jgi:hypothetical protein
MTATVPEPRWLATRRSFDGLVELAFSLRSSVDEAEMLRSTHWHLGEDARLREDFRFRPTPWNRWILSEAFLANDVIYSQLHRERRPSLDIEATLAELDVVVKRKCVVCPGDPRLVVDGGSIRLSARELTDQPLLEPSVTDIERYVSHLPVHTLKAAAACAPAGEWGRRPQEEVIDTLGWVKVSLAGQRLNKLMFVGRIEGDSMDDGASGLVNGGYAVFELWPAGTKQNQRVLVRGAFNDPETGSYALKKYVGDARGEDGRHKWLKLVSLNPDRSRFPDIDLDPRDDHAIAVVARVVQALTPGDFSRRPRQEPRRGRRDLTSAQGRADIAKQLEDHAGRFFAAEPPPKKDEPPRKESWCSALVCRDSASGGVHLEVGPLRGLWSFVKRLQASGTSWNGGLLASNVRERSTPIAVPPSSGPWQFSAVGFEDDPDIDLSTLNVPGLEGSRVYVFRVDADGIGRAHQSEALSPGQRYRVLVPEALAGELAQSQRLDECGPGWFLWELELTRPVATEIIEAARHLGLSIGEGSPAVEWVVTPPADWRTNARGETYACFLPEPGPIAQFRESHVEVEGEAVAFLHGPTSNVSQNLPVGERHLVHLGSLAPGRYVVALVHHRTAVAPARAAFEIIDTPPDVPCAAAQLTLQESVHIARPGVALVAESRDLTEIDADSVGVVAPPGWPIRIAWREVTEETVLRRSMDDHGSYDCKELLGAASEQLRRRPVGDLVFDFAELGRVALPHDRDRHAEKVRARVLERLSSWGGNVERFAGRYQDLLNPWFEPVCAALGFDVERMPEGVIAEAPEHAMALRLLNVERQGERIERHAVRLLVLVEELTAILSPQMLTWIDAACAKEGIRDALLSDGLRWAAHRRGSRLALRVWDLKAVTGDTESFVEFLYVASEGV